MTDQPIYNLDSAVERHLDAPDTFIIPDEEQRKRLRPGDLAKAIFIFGNPNIPTQRMWVVITERTDSGYVGTLDNHPAGTTELRAGDLIEFAPDHVIDCRERFRP